MQEAAACCRDLPIIVGSSRSSNSSTSYVASYFACIALIRDFCFFKKLCSLLLCLHSSSILFVTFLQMSICTQRPNEEGLQYPPSTCPASLSETFFLFHSCKSQVTPWLASLVDKPFCFVLFVKSQASGSKHVCRKMAETSSGRCGRRIWHVRQRREGSRAGACAVHARQEGQENNRLFFLQSCGASLLLPRALLSVKICLEPSFFFFLLWFFLK